MTNTIYKWTIVLFASWYSQIELGQKMINRKEVCYDNTNDLSYSLEFKDEIRGHVPYSSDLWPPDLHRLKHLDHFFYHKRIFSRKFTENAIPQSIQNTSWRQRCRIVAVTLQCCIVAGQCLCNVAATLPCNIARSEHRIIAALVAATLRETLQSCTATILQLCCNESVLYGSS